MAKISLTPSTASIVSHTAATNRLITRIAAISAAAAADPATAAIAAELRQALKEAFPDLQLSPDAPPPERA